MKPTEAERQEFHYLDMMGMNGQQMSAELVHRWVKLFRRYFKPKISDYQLSSREIKKYRKLKNLNHFSNKSYIKSGFLGG